MHFHKILREKREKLHLSINKLGEMLNLKNPSANIGAWERGTLTPSLPLAVKLAKILDINLNDLEFEREPKRPKTVRLGTRPNPKFKNEIHQAFCDMIRKKRLELRLTHEELGKRVNAERRTVLAWENGKHLPDGDRMHLLEQVLDFRIAHYPEIELLRRDGLSRTNMRRRMHQAKSVDLEKEARWHRLMYDEQEPRGLSKGFQG